MVEENHEINCTDFDEVANFSFGQYDSLRAQALADYSPDAVTVAEAYSVLKILTGLIPISEVAYEGKNEWVQALIPESLHAPICNEATTLTCCNP